jgi:hypothetical protein
MRNRGRGTIWGILLAWAFAFLVASGLFGFVEFLVFIGLVMPERAGAVFLALAVLAAITFTDTFTDRVIRR